MKISVIRPIRIDFMGCVMVEFINYTDRASIIGAPGTANNSLDKL
jgi:hypothetical protein